MDGGFRAIKVLGSQDRRKEKTNVATIVNVVYGVTHISSVQSTRLPVLELARSRTRRDQPPFGTGFPCCADQEVYGE